MFLPGHCPGSKCLQAASDRHCSPFAENGEQPLVTCKLHAVDENYEIFSGRGGEGRFNILDDETRFRAFWAYHLIFF
jgi:hypothetical protein